MSTFVLVHGSWGRGRFWQQLVPHLEARGHEVVVVEQMPSAGSDPAALGGLADDVAHLSRIVDDLDDVVLVGHSGSGLVVTELAAHPSVVHSVYITAVWLERGQSFLDLLGDAPPAEWFAVGDDGVARIVGDVDAVSQVLWQDLDAERAAAAYGLLQLQSIAPWATPVSAPARTHPATYIICERDRVVPDGLQEAMAQRADAILRIDTSHCPMADAPETLADALDRAVRGAHVAEAAYR